MIDFPGRIRSPLTTATSGRNVPWLLDLRAEQRPDHPFVVWEPLAGRPNTWTYREFAQRVAQLAAGLRARGIGAGDKVVVHLENCPEFLLSWFACARIGAVAVCTNTRSSQAELSYYGEHSEAVAAITQPRFADVIDAALPDLRWLAVTATDAGQETSSGSAPGRDDGFEGLLASGGAATADGQPADVGALEPAWIQYTSGTTSRPKAVVLTHANALWGAKVSAAHESLTRDDVHLIHLPLFHINALCYSALATLWAGGTAVVVPRFSASRFWDVARRNRCTWVSVIPFVVRALAAREIPEHHFRLWGNGYSSPPEDALFGVRTIGWYGMTETVSHPVIDEPENPGLVYGMGRPAPEYEVDVRRTDGTPVEVGETGSIFVRGVPGVSLFAGYLHDPEATAAAVDGQGWLDTGDLVTVHANGFMSFSDRDKDMLKVGGENVAASEIERVIVTVPGVTEVAVVAGRHPMLDEVPVAFVTADGLASDDERRGALADEVMAACKTQLADFKVPTEVRVVDELPRSTLNKIAKAELRAALAAEREDASSAS